MDRRRTASEIIATHLCWDMKDVSDCRYQPTRYATPAVYSIGDYYYCSPSKITTRMPMGRNTAWDFCGAYHGRSVFRVHMNEVRE